MEDLYFEKEFRRRCEASERESILSRFFSNNTKNKFDYLKNRILERFEKAYLDFDDVLFEYIANLIENVFNDDELMLLIKKIEEKIQEKTGNKRQHEYTNDELDYIKANILFGEKLELDGFISVDSKSKEEFSKRMIKSILFITDNPDEPYYKTFNEVLKSYKNKIFPGYKESEKEASENLISIFDNYEYSPEEIDYINLPLLNKGYSIINNEELMNRVFQVIIRNQILQAFDRETIAKLIETLNTYQFNYKTKSLYNKLLSDNPYGDMIHQEFEKKLEEYIADNGDRRFDDSINCGGYALKVNMCMPPIKGQNIGKKVSTLLDGFSFIRLLGDSKLNDDEYMVIYRVPKKESGGHHYIRVDSDGTVREKDTYNPPQIFEKWPNALEQLDDAYQIIFAVKKEHEMFDAYDTQYIFWDETKSFEQALDFEETVDKSIRASQNDFSYHNHNFRFKQMPNGTIIIIDDNSEKVAEVLYDSEETIVDIVEEKKDYIENLQGSIEPIIENGKLVNFDEFKNNKEREEK